MIDETVYCVEKMSGWRPSVSGDGSFFSTVIVKNIDTKKNGVVFLDNRFNGSKLWNVEGSNSSKIEVGDLVKNLPKINVQSGKKDRLNGDNAILVKKADKPHEPTPISELKDSKDCLQCSALSQGLQKHLDEVHQVKLF